MRKRMFIMLAIVIVFLAIVGGFKASQIRAGMAQQASFTMPPETVTTTIVRQENWDTTLNAIGTVVAVQGVTVSADLPGIIEQIAFDSGRHVRKGDVLVRLDTKQEQAQLNAALAQLGLKKLEIDRSRDLVATGIVPQSQYDQVNAEYKQAAARVGEIRATIERKIIRAPFSGVLGIRQVNLGQYVAGGSGIVSLQSLQPVYVRFSVPQQEVARLRAAGEVRITSDAFEGTEVGRVTAVESQVDESTRNVQVQSVFDNKNGKLRPGMFVETQLARGAKTPLLAVPASAVAYAPFGDSLFIVEPQKDPTGKTPRKVRQQFVKLGPARGDMVAVTTGLKPGEEVVTSGVFKLRPDATVVVNNTVTPGSSTAPKPEDS